MPTPVRRRTKRCALLVGNGLSIDLVEHLRMSNRVNLRTLDPRAVRYDIKGGDPRFLGRLLTDPELFPYLPLDLFRRGDYTLQELCLEVHDGAPPQFNMDKSKGRLSPMPNLYPLEWQFRSFLWLLFENLDRRVRNRLIGLTGVRGKHLDWRWAEVLWRLVRSTDVVLLSYNYEVLLETVMSQVGIVVEMDPNWRKVDRYSGSPNHVLALKPHGSIA